MVEISEKERARRKAERLASKTRNEALSFRLGPSHIKRLREISEWQDVSQVDMVRRMIDKKHKELREKREAVLRERQAKAELKMVQESPLDQPA